MLKQNYLLTTWIKICQTSGYTRLRNILTTGRHGYKRPVKRMDGNTSVLQLFGENSWIVVERAFFWEDTMNSWSMLSACVNICYQLIPLFTNGEIFGMESEVSIHLLDRSSYKDILEGIVMETQDLASPLLRSVSSHTELNEAFLDADVIVLLDDILQESIPTIEDCIRQVTHQCEIYGPLIEKNAKSSVRVVVMGKTFTNLKALMLMTYAPSINPRNIVTIAMLLESEAKAMVARKLQMHPAGIKNLIVWGNICGCSYVDLNRTELYRYDSAIWGPPSFFRHLLDVLFDREWMRTEFVTALSSLSSWGSHCLGLAPAHTIATMLRYWYQGSPPGEMVSLGVITEGQFGLPEGIVYSMPVRFENGTWIAFTELEIDEKTDEYLHILACDLIREKQVALGEVEEMYPQRGVRKARIYVEDEEEEAAEESPEDVKYATSLLENEDQITAEETGGSRSPEEENEEESFDVPGDYF
ncbi:putative malate dehydrogenase 1B isoform X2 [Anolis carolinensis]|uniref:putative malate dehydrogenase 1B isoform X2 n=2 Tax=Anolis carolinensis TaxID=28377 RepID=UPI0004628BF6|nr:PREDICTED: putative malate dehydrogenase 1B isoform X2 [Anolis carolinensis]|eukprot:XP_008113138.1 PREDICTED: putative malate dehydrogenase 1B isoform X2 [Anolis carolinensis]